MIVEVKREIDFDSLDPLDDEPNDEDTEQGAFGDFVQQVRQILPVNAQNVDVYIGLVGRPIYVHYPPSVLRAHCRNKMGGHFRYQRLGASVVSSGRERQSRLFI